MIKLTIEAAHERITNMRGGFQVNNPQQNFTNEAPLRAALFSAEQMDLYTEERAKNMF